MRTSSILIICRHENAEFSLLTIEFPCRTGSRTGVIMEEPITLEQEKDGL